MSSVRELELKLEEAKRKEKEASLQKEVERMKKYWLGKTTATHTFQRIRHQIHAYIEKVVDVVIIENSIHLKVENIKFLRNNTTTEIVVSEAHKAWHHRHHYIHDITPEQYDHLKNIVKSELYNIGELFREGMKKPDEYHTIGDSSDYRTSQEQLESVKAPFIDLSEHPEFIRILSWRKHPMLIGRTLLITPHTIQILKNIKQDFIDLANGSFSSRNSANYHKDADLIQKIIDYYNKINE